MNIPVPAIVVHFHLASAALPKHARLRQAVINAIEAGDLSAGAKVMGERELSEALGLSLGTTQKALGKLMDEGFLVRKQGHGTFVGSDRRPIAGTWHFRFVAPEGGPELPVFATITARDHISEAGAWSSALGADPKGYVQVSRRLDVGGKFVCLSQMYLGATRFAKLLRIAEKRLADTNLKAILENEFSAPTLRSEGFATMVPLSLEDAAQLSIPAGTFGMQLDIVGHSFGHVPITFQRVLVPPTRFALKLDFFAPQSGNSDPPGRHDSDSKF